MTSQVNLGVGVVDNTQSGLSSAERNISKFSKKSIKQLELEAKVSFPSIAGQIDGLEKNFSALKRKLGKFQFSGMRVGKKGNILGDMLFDAREIRGNLSTDVTKGLLDNLKAIQKGLSTGSVKSNNILGIDTAKEIKKINELIAALETYNKQMKVIERAWGAQDTAKIQAEKRKAYSAEFEEARRQKKDDELFRRRWAHEFGQWNKKDAELARLQREADRRAKAARIQYDQKINSGTDTRTPELNDLRKFYQEQEKLANKAAKAEIEANKEIERQFKSRIKAKRNAADIEIAIDNEQTLRARAEYRHFRTQENPSVKNIEKEIKALKKLKDAEDELDRAQGKKARNKLHRSVTNERIRDLERELEAAKKTAAERAKAEKDATDAAKRQSKARRAWIKREKALVKKLGGLILRAFSVHQIIHFGQKIAETTGYFEQQQIALEGILGSATKARSVLNDITNFALKSPFTTKDLVGFTKQLSAFGVGDDDLFPTVTKLADISAGLGVDMSRIILAYGQVKSASVLRGQELRQFTEAGIPMVDALSKKFTELNGELVTTADVFELISERKVSFEMVSEVLSDMTEEGGQFYKMQEELTNTLTGQISKLKDMWDIAMRDMGKSGNRILNGIVKLLQRMVKDALSFSVAIAAAFATPMLAKAIVHFKALSRLLRISFNSIKGIGASIYGLAAGALALAITKVIRSTTELKRAFEDIETSFRKETDKMIRGFDSLAKKISKAKVGTKEFADAVDTLSTNYGDFVSDEVIAKLKAQDEISERLAKNFGETANNIREAIIELKKFQELEEKRETASDMFLREKTEGKVFRNWMRNNKLGMSDMTKDVFKSMYGRDAINNRELLDIWDELYDDAVTLFATGEDLSKEEFERIFTETIKETFPEISEEELLRVVKLGWQATSQNTGTGFNNLYNDLVDSQNRITNSDYYKLQKTFEDWTKEYKDSEDFVEKQNNMEAAYFKALRDSVVGKFGENDLTIALESAYGMQDGKVIATNFDNQSVNNILKVLEEFESTITDEKAKTWFSEAKKLFKEGVEDKSDRAAVVSDRMEAHEYLIDEVVSGLWRQYIPNNKTYKALREQIKSDYNEAKTELESYTGNDPKDKKRKDELNKIIDALTILASQDFYAVDLSDKTKGGAKQLPPELADFLSSLKNAYQRYNESVDKGGIGIGLNYVRTNEMFKEMFGEFFGGAEGEKFKALSGMKVGSQTVGELLSGKFLEGLEEGVIDFKAAALALAEDLENTGIKSYKQAGKQLRQWVDSTISKDSLNATMNELEKTIKDLTNSFEKVNKEVDLYRKLQENGTVKALGGQIGVTAAMAATPDSVRMQGQIQTLISSLNKQLVAQNISPLSLGSLSRIDEVYNAIENLGKITMMNNKAFDGTALGKISGDVTNLLKQLLETLIKEAASISGEVYSGNAMNDLVANATKRLQSGQFALTSKENIARNLGTYDMAAIKTLVNATQEDAKKIFDQFIKDNNFDVIARANGGKIKQEDVDKLEEKLKNIAKEFPALLRDELLGKIDELNDAIDVYNAKVSAPGSMLSAFNDYKNARSEASARWLNESNKNYRLKKKRKQYEEGVAYLTPDQLANLDAEIDASNERLEAMGGSVDALTEKLKNLAISNLQKSAQEAQTSLNAISSAANSVIDVFKSLMSTVNKVWDIMSDGDIPEGLKDTEAFLEDFGEAFNNLIAPIMAVMAAVVAFTVVVAIAGTTTAAVFGALIAVAAIFAGVIAAFQQNDRALEHDIEALEKNIKDTQTAMKNLDAAAERMVGIDKFKKQFESLSLNMNMYHDALEQARLEEEKKNTDKDKVKEYMQNAQEALDAFKNGLKGMFEEITGSVDELADAISSAMRSAFQSGENAARSFRSTVKEMIGDVVQKMLEVSILQPMIESAIQNWTDQEDLTDKYTHEYEEVDAQGNKITKSEFDGEGYLEELLANINDPKKAKKFYAQMLGAGDALIDAIENLPPELKDAYAFNSETSALSGGISGITEDTARTLEGLANSMLMQMILTNQELSLISQSGFAQVQVSWFNDMLQQARATRVATENLNTAITEMRNGVRPMSVTIS